MNQSQHRQASGNEIPQLDSFVSASSSKSPQTALGFSWEPFKLSYFKIIRHFCVFSCVLFWCTIWFWIRVDSFVGWVSQICEGFPLDFGTWLGLVRKESTRALQGSRAVTSRHIGICVVWIKSWRQSNWIMHHFSWKIVVFSTFERELTIIDIHWHSSSTLLAFLWRVLSICICNKHPAVICFTSFHVTMLYRVSPLFICYATGMDDTLDPGPWTWPFRWRSLEVVDQTSQCDHLGNLQF